MGVDTRIASATPVGVGGHLDRAYVDWASVVGGAVVATAIFTTLSIFGSAVGLSLTSASAGSGISAKAAVIAVGLWSAWIAVSSFAAGGYIAGRLRHRIADATQHEAEMRDGLHGLIAWAVAALVSGLILTSAVGGLASAGGHGTAAATAQSYALTKLFHGEKTESAASRDDATALLTSVVAAKDDTASDRAALTQVVTAQTGLPAATAATRVDDAVASLKGALDQARRGAVLAAFLAAVSLALGAAGGWWAGTEGGKHRDEGTLLSPFTKWS